MCPIKNNKYKHMKMRLLFFLLFIVQFAFSQKLHYELPENASKMYNNGNFLKAKELYRELYKKNQKNLEYKFRFGVSLINTYEWDDGVTMLEQVSKKVEAPKEVWFHLGRGYHLTNRYDLAIKTLKKYIQFKDNSSLIEQSNKIIEMCENAKELVKKPLNVSFENLGKSVNSKGKEYLPFISPNEDQVIFSTRREGTTGKIYDLEGYYTADIYVSSFKSTKWSKTRSYGYPNSYGNEQVAGYSENGKYIFFYLDNPKDKNQLHLAEREKKSFGKSQKIENKHINEKSSKQPTATISNDGMAMIFTSDRSGGRGGFDLYLVKKLPNGKWGEPTNLGEEINTSEDENYPYLTDEGSTLYFASKGHKSIGGYDIFKSEWNEDNQKWSTPKNLGYPINTPDDNMSICFTDNKKIAYVSAYRKDSEGDLDIYRVHFKDDDEQLTTVKGIVFNKDSTAVTFSLTIEAFNETSGDLQGIFEVNKTKGSFIMILPPNKYVLKIATPTGETIERKIWIKDGKGYKNEIEQNFIIDN